MSWSPGPDIEVRVVTEDGAPNAHETVTHLLRRMLQILEVGFATNRLKSLPVASPEQRLAAQPHRWRGKSPEDKRRVTELARAIATDLRAARFVVMHADADARWSDRPGDAAVEALGKCAALRAALAPPDIPDAGGRNDARGPTRPTR